MDNKKYKSYTTILFAKNGFLQGIMRTFDLFGVTNSYNTSKSGLEADRKALYSDWLTIGNDIRNIIYESKKHI